MGKHRESSKPVPWTLRTFQFEMGKLLKWPNESPGSHESFLFYTTLHGNRGSFLEPNGIMEGKNGLSKGQAHAVLISRVKRSHQPCPFLLAPRFPI